LPTTPKAYLQLSPADRREALTVVAAASGRPSHLLEKDVWVVWTLNVFFNATFAAQLVFKGGTSLSKAYGVLRRFSEDIDITYDIRAIASDLIGDSPEALPPNRSQEKRWTREIRYRLSEWVGQTALPLVDGALASQNLVARAHAEGDRLMIDFDPLATGTGYVSPTVLVEFGARSTGEPCEIRPVRCDAAEYLPNVVFPEATTRAMRPERTFWEKATAIHVFCAQGAFRGGERFSRHWHDLTKLDAFGFADAALANREVATAVARHKAMFFAERDSNGIPIDYDQAVSGGLHLVPNGAALDGLEQDYLGMVEDGLLLDEAEQFSNLMNRCREIERKANGR
jgi:hypothetical protein